MNSLATGRATSASSKACLISFKPDSTCSSLNEGALFSLEKIFSNLFVKFSNISLHATPMELVGEPSLTSVDALKSKSTAKTCYFAESEGKVQFGVLNVNE